MCLDLGKVFMNAFLWDRPCIAMCLMNIGQDLERFYAVLRNAQVSIDVCVTTIHDASIVQALAESSTKNNTKIRIIVNKDL